LKNKNMKFFVPPKLLVDRKNHLYLLYDYQNHNWIVLNEDGKKIFDYLKDGYTPAAISKIFSSRLNTEPSDIEKKILQFIDYLVETRFAFLEKDQYVPRPQVAMEKRNSPQQCSVVFEKCNLKCIYCYNNVTRENYQKKYREMTTDEFKMALGQLLDFGIHRFMFSGGEPTLRTDLLKLADFVKMKSKDSRIALVTNGTKINDQIAPKLVKRFDLIWVSLDSYKEEEHDALRGEGSYAKTVRGIEAIIKAGASNVLVNSMVSDYNYKSMEKTRDFVLNKLGAHNFRMSEYQPFKNIGAGEGQLHLKSPPTSFSIDNEEELITQTDIEKITPGAVRNVVKEYLPRIHCGVAHGEISLHSNGNIFPCQNFTDDSFICGNILEENIEKIYSNSPIMKRMREATVYKIEACRNCEVKYVCHGSCRASAYEIHGNTLAHFGEECTILKRRDIDSLWKMPVIPFNQVKEIKKNEII